MKDMLECDESWVECLTEEIHKHNGDLEDMIENILFDIDRCPHCAKMLSSYKMIEPHGEILPHYVCPKCGEL